LSVLEDPQQSMAAAFTIYYMRRFSSLMAMPPCALDLRGKRKRIGGIWAAWKEQRSGGEAR
jgi:hypothetical protein